MKARHCGLIIVVLAGLSLSAGGQNLSAQESAATPSFDLGSRLELFVSRHLIGPVARAGNDKETSSIERNGKLEHFMMVLQMFLHTGALF